MKQFKIPEFYRSPIISEVKAKRKLEDPRKKDFSPSKLVFKKENGFTLSFFIARHFGFCYGVENAIEIAYKAIFENPGKKIYLLSQMIHNPGVNEDLQSNGIEFIQDTSGKQLIEWEHIQSEDIVIIPAFGTTLEIEEILTNIGVNVQAYNTTCPFVEKVWNRSDKLGSEKHTIIIHGKSDHEETRATFSHSSKNAPSLVIKDLKEAKVLCDFILGKRPAKEFYDVFLGKHSLGFDVEKDLLKLGVINQTTMLASETQEITEFINSVMKQKFGEENLKSHMADTRDTLCYATNDNQSATYALMEEKADSALVVGGYNSSNTTHLVELLEQRFQTFYIKSADEIIDAQNINSYNIHSKNIELKTEFLPQNSKSISMAITAGASCPDAIVESVIQKILHLVDLKMTDLI